MAKQAIVQAINVTAGPRPFKRKGQRHLWTGSVINGREVSVKIDEYACMGSGSCVVIAPKVFRLDWEKKKSIFIDKAPLEVLDEKGEDSETIFLAAQSCPYRAIKLVDASTGEQIYP